MIIKKKKHIYLFYEVQNLEIPDNTKNILLNTNAQIGNRNDLAKIRQYIKLNGFSIGKLSPR